MSADHATMSVAKFLAEVRISDVGDDVLQRLLWMFEASVGSGLRRLATPEARALCELVACMFAVTTDGGAGTTFVPLSPLPYLAAVAVNSGCIVLGGVPALVDETSGFAPGATVVPRVVAAAESSDASPADVLEGFLVGAELGRRVGHAIFQSGASSRWSMEGVAGRIAAAVAAVKTFGGGVEQFRAAMGLAATQAAGLPRRDSP